MSVDQTQRTPLIRGFAGEDLNNVTSALPPNIAQDARNVDYYRQTIRKRAGFKRLDDRAMQGGGISIRLNNTTPGNIGNISWAPAASWAVSMVVQMEKASCSGTPKILRCGTPATDGFNIYYDVSNDCFVAEIETSGGTKILAQANGSYTNNSIVALQLIYYVSAGGTKYYRFYQDTTLVEDSHASHTYSAPASPVLRWAYNNASQTVKFWLDEVRMWDLASSDDSAYATWLAYWTTDQSYKRELTTAEVALSTLTKYYRFNPSEFSFGSGFTPTDGSGTFAIPIISVGVGSYLRENTIARGLVNTHYDTDYPRCTALTLWPSDFGELWIRFGAEIFHHVDQTTVGIATYASRVAEMHQVGSGVPTAEAWSIQKYRNILVAVHPNIGCFHIDIPSGSPIAFKALVPIRPDVTVGPVTASDSGGGAGPGAGVYSFIFFYRNSDTGVTSASSNVITVTMAGGNAIQIDSVSSLFQTRRPLLGADYIDIFRTKTGGSTYYYMETVALSASPTTPHNTAAINIADASIAETSSWIALKHYWANRTPLSARAVFEHRGVLVLVAPRETGIYQEAANYRDTFHSAIMWADPLSVHRFATNNYKEVLPDVSDYLIGGISVAGGALLAKRYSLVAAYGDNLQEASYRHISHKYGCLAHNSIAASDQFVYLLSDKGIVRVAISLQPGSVELVQQKRFKPIYDDIDPSRVGMAHGAYHHAKNQYWVSFDTLTYGRVTLVFDESENAIFRYDHEIEAFYHFEANDPASADSKLVGSWRGYLVELDSSQTDGADVNANTITLTGTVTSADAQSLTDSGQAWPTSQLYGLVSAQEPYGRLCGLKIVVRRTSDGVEQTNTIYHNTATRVWANTPWEWTPSAGDTFTISGINFYWKSAKLCPQGDPFEHDKALRLGFLQQAQGSAKSVDVDFWVDGVLQTEKTRTLDTSKRRQVHLINSRGYEVEFQVSNAQPNAPVEIEGYFLDRQEAKVRP